MKILCLLTISAFLFQISALHAFSQAVVTIKMSPTLTITASNGNYLIQRAAVLGSVTNWTTITNVSLTGTPYIFCDITASGSQHFYRAIQEVLPENPNPQKLVWIPPGTFMMGSPLINEDNFFNEGPQTRVTITQGFWMSKYKVTQEEYQSVMGSNPSYFTGDLNRPVEQVHWVGANNYCLKLTQKELAAGRLPAGYYYRLPTEAEWEYACRAGTSGRFSYGDDAYYEHLSEYSWYVLNSGVTTHPVGKKLPNPYGLYDMHGNVYEWCLDHWSDALPGGCLTDPLTTGSGLFGGNRICRGGSFGSEGRECRSSYRNYSWPGNIPNLYIGFRVVLSPVVYRSLF